MTGTTWLLFAAVSLLWGVPYLFIKVAVNEVDPTVIAFTRVGLASVVLLPVALSRRAFGPLVGRWRAVVGLSLVEIVVPFLLIASGEQHITSSLAGLLIAADPLFIAVLARWLDRSERVTGPRLVGLGLGFLGVLVLLGLDPGTDPLRGIASGLVLLAAVCYAGGALLIKGAFSRIPAVSSVTASLLVASAALAPLAALHLPARLPSLPVLGSLVALGTVCTALGFLTYFSLIAKAGASRAALITYVNPAVAVLVGALVLGETVTVVTGGGFLMIVSGCWLSSGGGVPRWRALGRRPSATRRPV